MKSYVFQDRANNTYYQDDFTSDKFKIVEYSIEQNISDIPLPYQIMVSKNRFEKFEITWTYPQLRKLTRISIESELINLCVSYFYFYLLREFKDTIAIKCGDENQTVAKFTLKISFGR